jgi:CheY-like chemotaxis protein
VLVVDDNPANLLALEALLLELGFQVELTNSGSEALKKLSERLFACVLLDVRMPGIDGFETAALIRKREHWTVIFAACRVWIFLRR